jgi:hypothetical protein
MDVWDDYGSDDAALNEAWQDVALLEAVGSAPVSALRVIVQVARDAVLWFVERAERIASFTWATPPALAPPA